MKEKYDIIAQQYLEVCSEPNGSWTVELVIENISYYYTPREKPLRYSLSNFKTMKEGDDFARAWRFCYDKSIFAYDLM